MDAVEHAAHNTGRSVESIFKAAVDSMRFSNGLEAFKYRYGRWLKYGEIPTYVEKYCSTLLNGVTYVQPQS